MISVTTYLLKDVKIKTLADINSNHNKYFILCDSKECLNQIRDFDYIEGVVTIQYDNNYLVDFRYWDLVDQLYIYFLDAIELLLGGNQYTTFLYPDQPVEVTLCKRTNNILKFSIDGKSYIVDYKTFINGIINSAETFFSILINCKHTSVISMSTRQLHRILKIRKSLKDEL